ncbi:MAG: DUF2877 domain-containing protein [Spirochaetia bacterium]|jgi:hypothetical protein
MGCFAARACGALAGRAAWAGRVLSVHPRAVNILRADGLAVSAVADRADMSAMAVLSNDLFQTPPDTALVDTAVRMEEGVISFDAFASVDCTECPVWEGNVNAAAVRLVPVERIHAIRDSFFTFGKPGGLLGLLRNDPVESPFVTRVRTALREGRPEELVGCGPGLTPAGDDFLTGAILASSSSNRIDGERLERVLPGTTPLGRTLVWTALQGRFPAYLLEFIDAIVGAAVSDDALRIAVRKACAHGETSGTDALAGFCWQKLS